MGTWVVTQGPTKVYSCNNFFYKSILGDFNNWAIVEFANKGTDNTTFEEINEIIVDGLAMNMAPLIKPGNFGAIRINNDSKHGYEIVQFKSDEYAPQEQQLCNSIIMNIGELVLKVVYLLRIDDTDMWYRMPTQHRH